MSAPVCECGAGFASWFSLSLHRDECNHPASKDCRSCEHFCPNNGAPICLKWTKIERHLYPLGGGGAYDNKAPWCQFFEGKFGFPAR